MYSLEYLPGAMQDMAEIARYMSHVLSNPAAAEKLAGEMVEAADRLADFPYKNRVYQPIRPLKREYRGQIVQNYIMFYSVDEDGKLVTIARVIYARRDYGKLLG
ncbi:MAG: type II toxin-antitoxin system RelE/ParE family toxin [Oscillospiraceae bacterium]|nr:type II toxin-antitoxin system RelE/ParE family toxin [Oscillospiraceae bacterium]